VGGGYRGRFAPSPTGDLHLGTAATALVAWLSARSRGGRFLLRVEDLDRARVVAGSEQRQREDLLWLGLDWDEGPDLGGPSDPYRQSERAEFYEEAIQKLADRGLTYFCDCSRAEIFRVASAPHPGEEGPRYPGTCRDRGAAPFRKPPSVRLRVPDRVVAVEDGLQGKFRQNVGAAVGDFVLKRSDAVYAYQLAVVVDDLAMGVSEVVRGSDLLSSAPRQALLAGLLGQPPPAFAHTPILAGSAGGKLAKRDAASSIRSLRASGLRPEQIVGRLARLLGLTDRAEPRRPEELLKDFDRARLQGIRTIASDRF
jgi:glutamyl-tRNA synthetase